MLRGKHAWTQRALWLKNGAPGRPAHAPAGSFPLGGKLGQLCSGLEWAFGAPWV